MLLLWILSLAASFLLPATGEVGSNFQHCTQFFLDGNPPNLVPKNPARICQMYNNKYQFATMYDRDGHIPLFCAYKFQNYLGASQVVESKIEPQLARPGDLQGRNMESEHDCHIPIKELKKSQAVSDDYFDASPYDKGQLVPASCLPDGDSEAASYTLTNTVPQFQDLIIGEWENFVRRLKQIVARCYETYVVVGVVPGKESIAGNRVNIPSHIWAAVCCLTKSKQKESWAFIAENNQNKVEKLSLKELERELNTKYMRRDINLFNGACY